MSTHPIHGNHLWELLPEVYRDRDLAEATPQHGHLRAYLDAHGVLLDRLRETLEQLYADHFPDVPEAGRVCQAWVIPYLADLVGATIVSPFADGQRDEVANAVRWSKAKGTLKAAAEMAETVTQAEAVLQEGVTRLVRFAVPGEPILPAPVFGEPAHLLDAIAALPDQTVPWLSVNPQLAARHPGLPGGTLDLGLHSRAVRAPAGTEAAYESRFGQYRSIWPRDDNASALPHPVPTTWRQAHVHGAPCYPGSFEDVSIRTVDIRTPDPTARAGRYHPERLMFFLPLPFGFFPLDPEPMEIPADGEWDPQGISPNGKLRRRVPPGGAAEIENLTGKAVQIAGDTTQVSQNPLPPHALPLPGDDEWDADGFSPDGRLRRSVAPDGTSTVENVTAESVAISGQIFVTDGSTRCFVKLVFADGISLGHGTLQLDRCAVSVITLVAQVGQPANARRLEARSSLVGKLAGADGQAEMEYCTVIESWTAAARLLATDSILPEDFAASLAICLRYSSVSRAAIAELLQQQTNTSARPAFLSRSFGEPGYGVFAPWCSEAILTGAEDGGEMGCFHDWRYAAQVRALQRKLADFLPMGMEPVFVWDERLWHLPPQLVT